MSVSGSQHRMNTHTVERPPLQAPELIKAPAQIRKRWQFNLRLDDQRAVIQLLCTTVDCFATLSTAVGNTFRPVTHTRSDSHRKSRKLCSYFDMCWRLRPLTELQMICLDSPPGAPPLSVNHVSQFMVVAIMAHFRDRAHLYKCSSMFPPLLTLARIPTLLVF